MTKHPSIAGAIVALGLFWGSDVPGQAVPDLSGTVSLGSGACSGFIARLGGGADSPALVITSGHCLGIHRRGEVVTDRERSMPAKAANGAGAWIPITVKSIVFSTMTDHDIALLELEETREQLAGVGVRVFSIEARPARRGENFFLMSGGLRAVHACTVSDLVPRLREDEWIWSDAVRYNLGCPTDHGGSGSALVSRDTGKVIGIHNTGNEGGADCTRNNPCEVDASGATSAVTHRKYGQQIYKLLSCVDAKGQFDLAHEGCRL